MRARTLHRLLAVPLLAFAAATAVAQSAAGRFLTAVGDVRIVAPDGTQRVPERGAELREGETVVTGTGALAQVRLADGGLLSIRAETEMKLDRFVHAGAEDRNSSMFISLLRGGLRSVTGLIGQLNRDGYRITTPTATIGIRGTDHQTFFMPPPAAGAPPPPVQPGTYDLVFSGQTVMTGRQGGPSQVISPNQAGFVPLQGTNPVLLPAVPQFLRSVSAPPAPGTTQQASPQRTAPAQPGVQPADRANDSKGGTAAVRQLSPAAREALRDAVVTEGTTGTSTIDRSQLINPIQSAPAATTVSPSATTVSPSTVLSPATTVAPTTTISPTLTAPATTTVSPSAVISPSTTVSPTISPSTIIAPTSPTISPSTTISPMISPSTTISPAISPSTVISPTPAPAPSTSPSTIISPTSPTIKLQTAPVMIKN